MAADGHEDFIMTIERNTFCWHGISTDLHTSKDFYTNVLGWTFSGGGEGGPVFLAPGGAVAHVQAPENEPPNWCSFLSVDDVDASTTLAAEHGSAVLVPPTDLPAGRFSVVTTPSGAVFALYQSAEADTMAKPGAGTVHWVELHSTAPEQDVAWFERVFGFTSKSVDFASGLYHVLEVDGVARGGVGPATSERSAFMAWVQVDDLDASLAKVAVHGGDAVGATTEEPAIGRMAVVSDPSGAVFGLIQPAR